MNLLRAVVHILLTFQASVVSSLAGSPETELPRFHGNASGAAQTIVSWDEYSVIVRGERIMFLSGEFHPFRLPSPGLWFDVFQKIKALGYSGVSFYTNWALYEGSPGNFRADGVFALEEFFAAATEAGIYLLARPGPYINSEVSGGGFPGWTSRIKGPVRSNASDWLHATRNYIQEMGAIISRAQITNGGPIILFQPENEYTICADALAGARLDGLDSLSKCLNPQYMAEVAAMWRKAGIVVPFVINDALPVGNFVPNSGAGAGDIWGYDGYPLGWGLPCSDPSNWDRETAIFPTRMHNFTLHMAMSPSSPFSIIEFQGGSAEPWGGAGVDSCAALLNNDFERVIYKTIYGFRTTIFNIYMMYGGSNWGNIGHPKGYSSYDIGAAISENRRVHREKYSELKLQANFLQVSPDYQTSTPDEGTFGVFTDSSDLVTTKLSARDSRGAFYIIRHSNWTSEKSVKYKLRVIAADRHIIIPQLGGQLTLSGRDSKIHVVNYNVGNIRLHYSSAEIFTWKRTTKGTVLVLYGGAGETHEFAVPGDLGSPTKVEGDGIRYCHRNGSTIIQWEVEPTRRVVHFGSILEVHLLWRNEAYTYYSLDLPKPKPIGRYVSESRINDTNASAIIKAGYLLRNATLIEGSLHLWGDINQTTTIEVITPRLPDQAALFFNGEKLEILDRIEGRATASVLYNPPEIELPDFKTTTWRYLDSLPEIQNAYNDHCWREADLLTTNNTRPLTTPMSLYASDYGFHSGSLIYRGHFNATGNETDIFLSVSGGDAFSNTVWLNSTYLGSWAGNSTESIHNQTLKLNTTLNTGSHYVITVLIDHMGLSQNTYIGEEGVKEPRGILDYSISGNDIMWKLTGNLGGENYVDVSRGPRNEGGLFAERQGYHLPGAPLDNMKHKSPVLHGVDGAGVGFFATTFSLDIPTGYDIPMSFVFEDKGHSVHSTHRKAYRVQLFINGWQFGEYVNNIGPQTSFPVPEGILNYNGSNYLALTLWSLEPDGVLLNGFNLVVESIIQSGYSKPLVVDGMKYTERQGY